MKIKIGIIGAIREEIYQFKKIIQNYKKNTIGNCIIYTGRSNKYDIVLIQSGIGKVSASIATMILINKYQPNFIINSGSAGSLTSSLKIGDIFIPKKICYYDVDLVNFGYSLGQIPGFPKEFKNNQILYHLFTKTTKKCKLKCLQGNLISGDSFIRHINTIRKLQSQFPSAIAVDMESAAISQVCHQFYMPLLVIKYISDSSNHNATKNFKTYVHTVSISSFNLINNALETIATNTTLKKLFQKK